jgi:hypothetical protein
MNAHTTVHDSSNGEPAHNGFFRGFVEGATSLFDIFRLRDGERRSGTPEDDAYELRSDVECIAGDFDAVLARIESASRK